MTSISQSSTTSIRIRAEALRRANRKLEVVAAAASQPGATQLPVAAAAYERVTRAADVYARRLKVHQCLGDDG
jgi:capsular polysaccharide biosynthesis protein